jgi:hypothetical protein
MIPYTEWYKKNKNVLNYLYNKLNDMSNSYGIILNDNNKTYNNFISMMYNESTKSIINKELYPEFYPKKYDCYGYQNYIIN